MSPKMLKNKYASGYYFNERGQVYEADIYNDHSGVFRLNYVTGKFHLDPKRAQSQEPLISHDTANDTKSLLALANCTVPWVDYRGWLYFTDGHQLMRLNMEVVSQITWNNHIQNLAKSTKSENMTSEFNHDAAAVLNPLELSNFIWETKFGEHVPIYQFRKPDPNANLNYNDMMYGLLSKLGYVAKLVYPHYNSRYEGDSRNRSLNDFVHFQNLGKLEYYTMDDRHLEGDVLSAGMEKWAQDAAQKVQDYAINNRNSLFGGALTSHDRLSLNDANFSASKYYWHHNKIGSRARDNDFASSLQELQITGLNSPYITGQYNSSNRAAYYQRLATLGQLDDNLELPINKAKSL